MTQAPRQATSWQHLHVGLRNRLPAWARRSKHAGLLLFLFFLVKGLLWLLLPLLALWELV